MTENTTEAAPRRLKKSGRDEDNELKENEFAIKIPPRERVAEKKNSFSQNEARKLLKTKGGCGKNGQNEPETKLAKLLKTRNTVNNEPKNAEGGGSPWPPAPQAT